MTTNSLDHATDAHLVAEMPRLAQRERTSAADFVEALAQFDARKLYLGLGFPSIYSYCAARLHLTDGAAYRRIEAARASRRHPRIIEMLRDGRLSLASASLVGPKLTAENAEKLLAEIAFKSKREVEVLLARLNPQPPVPSVIRKLPEPKPTGAVPATPATPLNETSISLAELVAPTGLAAPALPPASHRPVVAPLSEAQYKLQVTISAPARERLRAIQDLMRHRLPSGDPAAIVEHAFEVLHAELLKQKAAQVARPRAPRKDADARGRHIPAAVKRAVFRRDGGRCAFVAPDGTRCGSTSGVEFHHVQPFARAGDTTVENLEMRCRTHNGFEWTRQLEAEDAAATAP